jgi:hypothetical protein
MIARNTRWRLTGNRPISLAALPTDPVGERYAAANLPGGIGVLIAARVGFTHLAAVTTA